MNRCGTINDAEHAVWLAIRRRGGKAWRRAWPTWRILPGGSLRIAICNTETGVVYKIPRTEYARTCSWNEYWATFTARRDPVATRYVPDTALFLVNDLPVVAMEYVPHPVTQDELADMEAQIEPVMITYTGTPDATAENVRRRFDHSVAIVDWGGVPDTPVKFELPLPAHCSA